jgi:CubicO group peptidase (beta-lactamase class C family)
MTGRRIVCVVVGVAVLAFSPSPIVGQTSDLKPRLEALRAAASVPAVAGALFSSSGQPTVAVSGVRKLGDPTPATADDLWHIGSITKSFTSMLVARAVERGDLRWEMTLAEVFGAERAGRFGEVTMVQLLSHRAGLPANLAQAEQAALTVGGAGPEVQRQRVVDRVLSRDPASAPGESFLYSNVGYIIAGAVLEARLGKPWEDLVRSDVLEPLALTSAGQGPPGEMNVLSQPRGHRAGLDGLNPVEPGPFADNGAYLGPAGRLHMTITDLARWGQVHLRGERGESGVVSAPTFRMLHQPVGAGQYGLGWVVREADGRRVIWHNGSNTMWYAIVAFDAEADRGVVLITNGGIGAGPALDAAAMAALRSSTH